MTKKTTKPQTMWKEDRSNKASGSQLLGYFETFRVAGTDTYVTIPGVSRYRNLDNSFRQI